MPRYHKHLEQLEEYYTSLWSHGSWSCADPNKDERARWNAIDQFIGLARTEMSSYSRLTILDVGCGRGWLTNLLNEYGDTIGIDELNASINVAKRSFPSLHFICTSLDSYASKCSRRFDLIIASEVIEHCTCEEQREFLDACQRLLHSDGYVILTTPRGELRSRHAQARNNGQPIENWLTEPELTELCECANANIVARTRAYPGNRFLQRLMPPVKVALVGRLVSTGFGQAVLRPMIHQSALYQVVMIRFFN